MKKNGMYISGIEGSDKSIETRDNNVHQEVNK